MHTNVNIDDLEMKICLKKIDLVYYNTRLGGVEFESINNGTRISLQLVCILFVFYFPQRKKHNHQILFFSVYPCAKNIFVFYFFQQAVDFVLYML